MSHLPLSGNKDWQLKRRSRAALAHLALSVVVIAGAAAGALLFWYPPPFDRISGAHDLFKLIIGVDVLLGPLLTFVVVSAGKPRRTLQRDLTVIGLAQCAALAYGLWTVHVVRPLYLVYEVDRFQVVTANDLADVDRRGLPAGDTSLGAPLPMMGVRQPRSQEEMLDAVSKAIAGRDIAFRPDWWMALDAGHKAQMLKRGHSAADLPSDKPGRAELDALLRKSGVEGGQVLLLPVMGRMGEAAVVMRRDSLHVVGFVAISL